MVRRYDCGESVAVAVALAMMTMAPNLIWMLLPLEHPLFKLKAAGKHRGLIGSKLLAYRPEIL
jgi:hypothetical protein